VNLEAEKLPNGISCAVNEISYEGDFFELEDSTNTFSKLYILKTDGSITFLE
jgi:hypothetical protein